MINKFCKVPLSECSSVLADVAMGRKQADLVIKNARLVNVCTREIIDGASVAVSCGRIRNDSNALPPMHRTCAFTTAITSRINL